tara:strand:- start:1277 stop:2326 length:1050 start_codon:yes stop_codon:yes gene_type:complete
MNTIIKITLIIFLSIVNINNFVFSQDITRTKAKGLAADYYPIYVDNQPLFIKAETAHNCFQMSAVDLDLPGCQEYTVYTPPACGDDFYSCDNGEVLGELKEKDDQAIWTCENKKGEKEICNKTKEPNNDNTNFCGSSKNSCINDSELNSSGFRDSWTCKKVYDEMKSKIQRCSKLSLPKENGSCDETQKYKCFTGTLDIVSSTTWICRGKNGGFDDSCSYKEPKKINGSCGSTKNSCSKGDFVAGSGNNWTCKGRNGGSNASCSVSTPPKTDYDCSAGDEVEYKYGLCTGVVNVDLKNNESTDYPIGTLKGSCKKDGKIGKSENAGSMTIVCSAGELYSKFPSYCNCDI